MSNRAPAIMADETHLRVAKEVLELGETLFDTVIDAATDRPNREAVADESFPTEDLRAASNEFFRALRVLLGIERGAG